MMQSPENVSPEPNSAGPLESPVAAAVTPQSGCGCSVNPNGETMNYPYVYALGKIEPLYPTKDVEKEFAQVTGKADAKGLTDRQALHAILAKREYRYLARELCYVLSIHGSETYLLRPRDPGDFDLLVEAIRPEPKPSDLDCVIGVRGPIASMEMCNGLMIPIVWFDQIYSFDREALIKSIPRPEKISADKFRPIAEEVFERLIQLADNAGATDEDRLRTYLAVRGPAPYITAADAIARNLSLTAVDVRPSALSGTRKILEVIFSFTHRETGVVEKFSTSVDVHGKYPFLVKPMSQTFDR